jgi:hypothetical protein
VIRRGLWLAAGAVIGVTGYRRATRLARALTGQSAAAHTAQAARSPAHRAQSATAGLVSAAGFARDVRDGMAEYLDLHRDQGTRTLGSQGASSSRRGA